MVASLTLASPKCKKSAGNSNCYKGRLEVKGLCGNYTIALLEGKMDTARMEAKWKDDVTGKTYNNVFALGSVCSFPDSLKAGDEFYFTLTETQEQCAVCMAYYPRPQKSLLIKVLNKACN